MSLSHPCLRGADAAPHPCPFASQVEGAFVQGLGMWTCEEVVIDEVSGALASDSSWSYKIPTPDAIPRELNVHFLEVGVWARGV